MKIGILTLPLASNYGGILQCYALQTVLERMGHEVVVLDRASAAPSVGLVIRRCGSVLKCMVRRYIQGQKNIAILSPWSQRYVIDKRDQIDFSVLLKFVRKNINITCPLRSSEALLRRVKRQKLDCLIVGSDQVWRECYSPFLTDCFAGFFPPDDKMLKITYGASFGTSENPISEQMLETCKSLSSRFDAISVREESAVGLVEQYFGKHAELVLDPTLLLGAEDYVIERSKSACPVTAEQDTLVSYVLDTDGQKAKIANDVAGELGLKESFMGLSPKKSDGSPDKMIPVQSWLDNFRNASFVVTDSFHGCVFSVINRKPFIAIVNHSRGADRFVSMLSQLGLEGRMVNDYEEYSARRSELIAPIDYAGVYSKLQTLKAHSLGYLSGMLERKYHDR